MKKNFLNWNIFTLVAVSITVFLLNQISVSLNYEMTENILASVKHIKTEFYKSNFIEYINPRIDDSFVFELCSVSVFPNEDIERLEEILLTDPAEISKEDFDRNVTLLVGYYFGGSGGIFLCEEEIKWIEKGLNYFENKGQVSKEEKEQIYAYFTNSYAYYRQYDKALRYCGQPCEEIEWFIHNVDKKYGDTLELKEYDGEASCGGASIGAELETENYRFVRCFKGPTLMYNKKTDKHILIFNSVTEIQNTAGIHNFSWDGRYVDIFYGLFDTQTNRLLKIKEGGLNYDDYYTNAKCPEDSTEEEAFDIYMLQRADFYGRNPEAMVDEFIKVRMKFLIDHNCKDSLEDILSGGDETSFMRTILLKNFKEYTEAILGEKIDS